MGLYFSSSGPLFYHSFFPDKPDPYAGFVNFIRDYGPGDFPLAYAGGVHLLAWTRSTDMININAVAAFPSLHLAIAWLATLYGFNIDRRLGWVGVVFCVLIYLATILSGFHYAIDGYVSLAVVSLMWHLAGKLLDRRHGAYPIPLKRV
jgi:membrane-associated phospholipid phosphatase